MNIFGYDSAGGVLKSAGGTSLVANGSNLIVKGLLAGPGVTLNPSGSTITVDIDNGGDFLPESGGTMTGSIAMSGNNITNVGIISGAVNSRSADNIVSNAGSAVAGRVPIFTSDKEIKDGGALLSDLARTSALGSYLPRSGGSMNGAIDMSGNQIQNVGYIGGSAHITYADYILSQAGAWTVGDIPYYNSGPNRTLQSSGIQIADVVKGPASAVNNRIAVFAGTTGKALADGGALLSQFANLAGAAFTGAITGTTAAFTHGLFSGVVTALRFVSTTPTCYMTYNQPIAAVPYTANTAKLIDLGNFTELADPTTEFTTTAGTGKVTYTGATTQYFKCDIIFNTAPQASGSIYHWVSKNGSLTKVAARVWTFSGAMGYIPNYVTAIYQLSTGDTIQLAGEYSLTGNVSIFDCQYQITPVR